MDEKEFLGLYWKNYILLEKEFTETFEYITLDAENFYAYSSRYIKILLQIGSEIDVTAKLLCKHYNERSIAEKIEDYRNEIMGNEEDFCNTKVDIIQHCNIYSFTPWGSWKRNANPYWWIAYNKVKHERFHVGKIDKVDKVAKKYYKFANLKYTLYALAGLYQLMIYYYFVLVEETENWIKTPIPGSHLFKLTGNKWDNIIFYQDIAFHITENGYLIYETGIY